MQYAQAAVNQTANDLGVFKILSEADGPMGIDDIASKCGADSLLTGSIQIVYASDEVLILTRPCFETSGGNTPGYRSRTKHLRG